jgi:hypothetical protein
MAVAEKKKGNHRLPEIGALPSQQNDDLRQSWAQGLLSRRRWQHVRCTRDSCRPIASSNSSVSGQFRTSFRESCGLPGSRQRREYRRLEADRDGKSTDSECGIEGEDFLRFTLGLV